MDYGKLFALAPYEVRAPRVDLYTPLAGIAGEIRAGLEAARSQANSDREMAFRQAEAARAQGNADRSYSLQERMLTEGRMPVGFQRTEDGGMRAIPGGPSDPDYLSRATEAKADREPKVVPFGSTLVNQEGKVVYQGSPDVGLFDQSTLKHLAEQYRAGDTSVFTNLGRGAQGAQNIIELRKEVARQNAEAGISGADQAMRNAEFFGTKAGQRTLGTRSANIELAATEFDQVLPIVQKASQAVDRTRFPDLNRVMMAAQEKTGDPNVVAFGGGVNTLINLYARAISPTGVPTVSDKDHAREILSRAWTQGQFDAAVGMMKQEIGAALYSPERVRDEMRRRFIGGQGQSSPSASTGAASPALPPLPPGFQIVR